MQLLNWESCWIWRMILTREIENFWLRDDLGTLTGESLDFWKWEGLRQRSPKFSGWSGKKKTDFVCDQDSRGMGGDSEQTRCAARPQWKALPYGPSSVSKLDTDTEVCFLIDQKNDGFVASVETEAVVSRCRGDSRSSESRIAVVSHHCKTPSCMKASHEIIFCEVVTSV